MGGGLVHNSIRNINACFRSYSVPLLDRVCGQSAKSTKLNSAFVRSFAVYILDRVWLPPRRIAAHLFIRVMHVLGDGFLCATRFEEGGFVRATPDTFANGVLLHRTDFE